MNHLNKKTYDPFYCLRFVNWKTQHIVFGISLLIFFEILAYFFFQFFHEYHINKYNFLFIFFAFTIQLSFHSSLFGFPYFICYKNKIKPLFIFIPLRNLINDFFISIAYATSLFLILAIFLILLSLFFQFPETTSSRFSFVFDFENHLYILFLLIGIVIIGPICEEIFFRGFLYNSLQIHFSKYFSIIFQSILFAFNHGDWINFARSFVIGTSLAIIYERRKTLVSPIFVHIIINFTSTIYILY